MSADRLNPVEIDSLIDELQPVEREVMLLGSFFLAYTYFRRSHAKGVNFLELLNEMESKYFNSWVARKEAYAELGVAPEFIVDDIRKNSARGLAFPNLTDDDIDIVCRKIGRSYSWESGLYSETDPWERKETGKEDLIVILSVDDFVFEQGANVLTWLPKRFGLQSFKELNHEQREDVLKQVVIRAGKSGIRMISEQGGQP